MARATFVKQAQKNIYQRGKHVKYISEKGKEAGQEKTKLDRTIPADETDTVLIVKGESYWWWQFLHGGKNISKEKPRRSQLTQSGFLSQLYDLQDRIGEFSATDKDEFDNFKEEILSEIKDLKSQCEDSLSNMPEHLQEGSSSGEMLTERIDALDNWYSEIEGVECDYEEEEIRAEKQSEFEKEEGELDHDYKERIDEETNNTIEQIVNDAVEELSGADCGL